MLRRLAKDVLNTHRGAFRKLQWDQEYLEHNIRRLSSQLADTSCQPSYRPPVINFNLKPVWNPRWTSTTPTSPPNQQAANGTEPGSTPRPEGQASEAAESDQRQTAGSSEVAGEAGVDLQAVVKEQEQQLADYQQQLEDLKMKVIRTLADMENLRERTARQAENAQKFAIQGFVKGLLDVADNLDRAYSNIQEEVAAADAGQKVMDKDRALVLLKGLLDGVKMTDNILLKVFKANGVEKHVPVGEKFDPNLHSALFEIADNSKEAGTIAVVSKSGFSLSGRVVRPAEVGVVKAS